MLKLVLDANILVSAFITPTGESDEVLRQAKSHKLYLSSFILEELWRTLHYDRIRQKFQYAEHEIEQYLKNFQRSATIIQSSISLDVCTDPKDNAVLACAVGVKAGYLVTRNLKHFPKQHEGVRVISPSEFLNLVRSL